VLEAALGDWLVSPIEHIGSTAVPGLPAKPIIDMLAVIDRYEAFAPALTELERIGWIHAPEPGDPGQRKWSACLPNVEHRTHHLHVVERDSTGWRDWLVFRDFLHAHPEQAARYAALKQELSAVDAEDRPRYRAGKAPLIRELTDRARRWSRSGDDHRQDSAKAMPTAVSASADVGRP
jgi:GrpB-like predicted nucleotidyltransferase (UPF0157 family)